LPDCSFLDGSALLKAVGERAAFMASRRGEQGSLSDAPAERLSAA